ncbi:hypothetical protein GGI43DRAFT_389130 [Trichoderma evansii]
MALASPAEPAKRDTRNVFITTDANWQGDHANIPFGNNVVYSWVNNVEPWFGENVGPGSIGPDPGVCCILYANDGVTQSGTICNPGDSDLTGYWQFNTNLIKCWW